MKPDDLKRRLVEVPQKLHFKDSTGIQHYIFKVLYYSATDDGEYLQSLFPNISNDEAYDITNIYDVPVTTDQKEPFYKQVKSDYTHPLTRHVQDHLLRARKFIVAWIVDLMRHVSYVPIVLMKTII